METDRLGRAESNQKLSQERARVVADYLVSHGIAADKVRAEGRGETQPQTPAGACNGLSRPKMIVCLQPDRRVDVEVSGTKPALTDDERDLFTSAAAGNLGKWSFGEACLIASGVTDPAGRKGYAAKLDRIEADVLQAILSHLVGGPLEGRIEVLRTAESVPEGVAEFGQPIPGKRGRTRFIDDPAGRLAVGFQPSGLSPWRAGEGQTENERQADNDPALVHK